MRKNYESLASLFPESLPQFLHILPKLPSQDNVLVNFTIHQIPKATTSLWQFPGYIALVCFNSTEESWDKGSGIRVRVKIGWHEIV